MNRNLKSHHTEIEFETVKLMIELYCRGVHVETRGLCDTCYELLDYAKRRLVRCPHAENKMPCDECETHCYREPYLSRIKEVMRYSGPRMLHRHPILTMYHFLDGRRKEPLGYERPAAKRKPQR